MSGGVLRRRVGARLLDYMLVLVPTAVVGWTAVPLVQRAVTVQAQRVGRRTGGRIVSSGLDTDVLKDTARDSAETMAKTASTFVMALLLVSMVLWFLYDWIAHAVFGRTLGKIVFGIAVVPVHGGWRAGMVRGLVRSLILIGVPTALICYGWAYQVAERADQPLAYRVISWVSTGGLALALLPGNRALHDRLSFTRVETTR
ncbi:RDD family protein [Streptodolium elevatio]